MILSDDLTPVSKLSGAFLTPESPEHLQFAYYESSLVVEYLVEKLGADTLNRILDLLGVGVAPSESLSQFVGSPQQFDEEFAKYIRQKASDFGNGAEFDTPELPDKPTPETLLKLVADHPKNFAIQQQYAKSLIESHQWQAAKEVVDRLIALVPQYCGPDSPYAMAATIARQSGAPVEDEREALLKLVERESDAFDPRVRLAEIEISQMRWDDAERHAKDALAINPLIPTAYRLLSRAGGACGDRAAQIRALKALLELDPLDPADAHFRLADALYDDQQFELAKRQVLMALEFAPRYRAAHRLLLKIVESESDQKNDSLNKPAQGNGNASSSASATHSSNSTRDKGDDP